MKTLATIALLALAAGGVDAKTVAVTADRMIEVETGRVIDKPVVIITDGRITAAAANAAIPSGAERVDLPGVTLLPGLIDMHVHLDSDPVYSGYNYLQFSDRFWMTVAVANAEKTLKAGFTSVRNVGASEWNDVGLREGIDAGYVKGPRLDTAAIAFGATGGHCDQTFFPASYNAKAPFNSDNAQESVKAVRTLKKYGATVIKICVTGGVFSRGKSVGIQQMTVEEITTITKEAHMDGLRVAAHAHGSEGIKAAILGDVDTIEHASLIDDDGIALAIKHGAYLSMDIYNTDYTQSEGKKNGVLPDNLRKDAEIGELQRQNYKKALEAGAKMIYATDAGVYPHGDNAKQFAVMVRYGATPLQAIQSATITAAQALGWEGDVGTIKPGLFGDLVGVRGDPLKDVTVLETPAFVMKGGEVVRHEP